MPRQRRGRLRTLLRVDARLAGCPGGLRKPQTVHRRDGWGTALTRLAAVVAWLAVCLLGCTTAHGGFVRAGLMEYDVGGHLLRVWDSRL